jgi:hypothetical protein
VGFDALGAGLDPFAVGQLKPLKVGVKLNFSGLHGVRSFNCRGITFATDRTFSHKLSKDY